MAVDLPQFLLFLHDARTVHDYIARRNEGFPDEGDHIKETNVYRAYMIDIVNRVFQDGVHELFPALPALLAPGSNPSVFQHAISRAALHPRSLLIWRKLTPHLQHRFGAQYVISFYVPSQAPLAAVHLAYTLLNFAYNAIRTYIINHYDYDVNRQPKLKHLAYHLTTTSAHAVAFFDDIEDVYRIARMRSRTYPRFEANGLTGVYLSTTPAHALDLLTERTVLECFNKATAFSRL